MLYRSLKVFSMHAKGSLAVMGAVRQVLCRIIVNSLSNKGRELCDEIQASDNRKMKIPSTKVIFLCLCLAFTLVYGIKRKLLGLPCLSRFL